MKLFGYGEDALTLWALQNRLGAILRTLGDQSRADQCMLYFRPSFGRKGGANSPQFGEFDFILLTDERLVLGESKWDRSPEKSRNGLLQLRPEQIDRHKQFRAYVEVWTAREHKTWAEFYDGMSGDWEAMSPLPSKGSLLSENLARILLDIQLHFGGGPTIQDVLLYLYDGSSDDPLPVKAAGGLTLVAIDYSGAAHGNYIRL